MRTNQHSYDEIFGGSGICLWCGEGRFDTIHAPKVMREAGTDEAPITKPSNPKDAIGTTKPPLSTLPATVTHEVGLAMLEGACKYGRHNYRSVGVRASIYYDATMRHVNKWWEGQDIDPDSGLSHIVKALACLYVLRDAMIQDMLTDDRPPIAPAGFFADLEVKTKEILARYPNPLPAFTQKGESEKEEIPNYMKSWAELNFADAIKDDKKEQA